MTNKQLHNKISKFMEINGFETHEKFTAINAFHFSTFADSEHLIFAWTKEGESTIGVEIKKDKVCIGYHVFQNLKEFECFFFKEEEYETFIFNED